MKKIVMGIAALALASSVFAADFAARVYMTGNIADGKDGTTNLLTLSKTDQKDADALVVSVNGDKAGAKFQFWYNYNGGADAAISGAKAQSWEADKITGGNSDGLIYTISGGLQIRGTNLWFKPADWCKVTLGDVSVGTYKEMIHWWKDPAGGNITQFNGWYPKYSSYSSVEGAGVSVEITPVDGLWLQIGTDAGAGSSVVTLASDSKTYGAWGADVKYSLASATDLPISFAASYRDAGKGSEKIISVGGDYGNNWANGFYGFVNARMRIETKKLVGITIDNYFKYGIDAWKVMLRAPVTIRTSGDAGDPSHMVWEVKFTYALDGFTPYLNVGSDLDNENALSFADAANTFQMQIKPGVTFNVGTCALDVAFQANVPAKGESFSWSVPFTASVAF